MRRTAVSSSAGSTLKNAVGELPHLRRRFTVSGGLLAVGKSATILKRETLERCEELRE